MQPFDPTLRHKNGPWAWNSPYQEIKSPHSLCWTCYLVSFPASESMCAPLLCAPLLCLSMCAIWYLAKPTAICVPVGRRWGPLAIAQRGQLLRVSCWEGPAGHGGLTSIANADLALSLLCVSHAYSSQCLIMLFSLVTQMPRCGRQKGSDFH